ERAQFVALPIIRSTRHFRCLKFRWTARITHKFWQRFDLVCGSLEVFKSGLGIKKIEASIQRLIKRFFFAAKCFFTCLLFRTDFGKYVAHRFRDHVDQFEEEWFMKAERATVADCAPQD